MHLVTHSGKFHLDDVLSTAILLKIYPSATVTRTENKEIIENADIVYDVGEIFSPESKRFDHHQITFNETYSEDFTVKMSSAGLIYKYYKKELLDLFGLNESDENFKLVADNIYEDYFLGVDAVDNEYDIYEEIRPRTIGDMVSSMSDEISENNEDELFMKAVEFISDDLEKTLNYYVNSWLTSYKFAFNFISRCKYDILILKRDGFLIMQTVFLAEKKLGRDIKFVIRKHRDEDLFTILTVRKQKNSFQGKINLKEEWRGLRGEELEQKSGIIGADFVHASGFTGACKTLEGAMKMCKDSIYAEKKRQQTLSVEKSRQILIEYFMQITGCGPKRT